MICMISYQRSSVQLFVTELSFKHKPDVESLDPLLAAYVLTKFKKRQFTIPFCYSLRDKIYAR